MAHAPLARQDRGGRDVRSSLCVNFKVGRTLRPLTDLERKVVATNIVDHSQLSNWVIERGAPGGHTSPENWPKRRE